MLQYNPRRTRRDPGVRCPPKKTDKTERRHLYSLPSLISCCLFCSVRLRSSTAATQPLVKRNRRVGDRSPLLGVVEQTPHDPASNNRSFHPGKPRGSPEPLFQRGSCHWDVCPTPVTLNVLSCGRKSENLEQTQAAWGGGENTNSAHRAPNIGNITQHPCCAVRGTRTVLACH